MNKPTHIFFFTNNNIDLTLDSNQKHQRSHHIDEESTEAEKRIMECMDPTFEQIF